MNNGDFPMSAGQTAFTGGRGSVLIQLGTIGCPKTSQLKVGINPWDGNKISHFFGLPGNSPGVERRARRQN
jgi:hypothetical protein